MKLNLRTAAMAALGLAGMTSFCLPAMAQDASMTGAMGNRALLVVNGAKPKLIGAGETFQGVKVISVAADSMIVESQGVRSTLKMGATAVNLSGNGKSPTYAGKQIVLPSGPGGHFTGTATINNASARFMVDTGASVVAMSQTQAKTLGIDLQQGEAVTAVTANGVVQGQRIVLPRIRVGDVEVNNVDAVVTPMNMPYILLGNSFLGRFSIRQEKEMLILTKRP